MANAKNKVLAALAFVLAGALIVLLGNAIHDYYGSADAVPAWVGYSLLGIVLVLWGITAPRFIEAFSNKDMSYKFNPAWTVYALGLVILSFSYRWVEQNISNDFLFLSVIIVYLIVLVFFSRWATNKLLNRPDKNN